MDVEGYAKFMTLAAIAAVLLFAAAAAAMTLTVQSVKAIVGSCHGCAKDFAPGIEAQFPLPGCDGCAKDFAPGQEANAISGDAKNFAPGQEKSQLCPPTKVCS
jgi:hypothetical protein